MDKLYGCMVKESSLTEMRVIIIVDPSLLTIVDYNWSGKRASMNVWSGKAKYVP